MGLTHSVGLSAASDIVKEFSFNITDYSTSGSSDYALAPVFSDGVTYDAINNSITVPSGVSNFTFTIVTVDDAIDEEEEQYDLEVGGLTAVGHIYDNDPISISSISSNSANEGADISHTVIVSGVSEYARVYSFALTNGTTDNDDYNGTPVFSDGVTYNATNNLITVPPGVASFTVTVETVNDYAEELNEQYNLEIGGQSATGQIYDNDSAIVMLTETFTNGSSSGWQSISHPGAVATSQTSGELGDFLGRFGGTNGNEAIAKIYDFGSEKAGQIVTIEFDMYEIDSWDGNSAWNAKHEGGNVEAFQVFVNSDQVTSDIMQVRDSGSASDGGTSTSGNEFTGWGAEDIHHYSITTKLDDNGQVQLGFGSTLNQSIRDESWGIDNVTISETAQTSLDNVLYGQDDNLLLGIDFNTSGEAETFKVDGDNIMLSNFDLDEDVLDISELIDAGEAIEPASLAEYLEMTFVDADGDGIVDDTQIIVDSNGESDIGGSLTTILIQDNQINQNDLNDENIDYD